MKKIIQYGILALVVYVVVTTAPKWIENVSELGSDLSRKGPELGQGRCVATAEGASETFGRGLRNFSSPPVDVDSWDVFMEGLKEKMYDAETECDCSRDSCQRASEALAELRQLIDDFDGSLRGSNMPLNPARRQETIDRLLKRAREFDRQGN